MCNCHSILEFCVMFSGVKLSIRLFNLFNMTSYFRYMTSYGKICGNFQIQHSELRPAGHFC